MVVRIDEDEPSMSGYLEIAREYEDRVCLFTGDRKVLSDLWNDCWRMARGDIFWLCADDIVLAGPHGWDGLVRNAFPEDGIAYVHGDDLGGKGDRLGTHGFVSRAWTDSVGAFTPDCFPHDFADLWLNEISDRIGRRIYLPELITEHHHPAFGKAPDDETYRVRIVATWANARDGFATEGDAIWAETAGQREDWVQRLRKAMQ